MARSVLANVIVFISFAFAALRLLESTLPCLFRQKTGSKNGTLYGTRIGGS
jgi:hypothetical protein